MSGLGAGHVQEMPLEPGLGVGYAWLTRDKSERSDMSGLGAGHVQVWSLEPEYKREGQTCLAWADMSGQCLWNPARGADMSGLT
jgi:hypothetical protein